MQEDQGLRVHADRLRMYTRSVERWMRSHGPHWHRADIPEAVQLLHRLRQLARIAPNTPQRRILIRQAKIVCRSLAFAIREMRDGTGALSSSSSVLPVEICLPDATDARSVAPERAIDWGDVLERDPAEPYKPAASNEYQWLKIGLQLQGFGALEHYMTLKRHAQARYNNTPKAKAVARRYAQSEKGKAARKAAQARYRAKMKQSVNNT